MRDAILVEYYDELDKGRNLARFARKVRARYTEGTLNRMLACTGGRARQAALVALRFLGTMESNTQVARCLRDRDREVQELAADTLWALWNRADKPANNRELQRLTRLLAAEAYDETLTGLNALIAKAPSFAEAFNQRAILHWKRNDFAKAVADCERVLDLNPYHFGALAGLGQCYLGLRRPADALRAFRQARRIYPGMAGIGESIRTLEQVLDDDRRRRGDRRSG